MRILLIQTAFIGDAILATALLEKLHYHFPDAQLDLLVRKGNEMLFKGHPFLNNVLIWNKEKGKYRSLWTLLTTIRQRRYDRVINLQRYGSTGVLTAFSGAWETIGFDKNPFARFFTHRVVHRIQPGVHEVDRNTDLVRFFTDETVFRPRLYPPNRVPHQSTDGSYVCIAPTSVWFTKQFPESQWIAFINALPPNLTVYLLGGPGDVHACETIRQACIGQRVVENRAGKLGLLESAALMRDAVLNYVNDSAPMHLCSAVNAPTCAVFCSTVPGFGYGPLADFARIVDIEEPLYCRPCGLHGHEACPEGHFRCALDIRIIQLLDVLKERLRQQKTSQL
ncbi:MAG: glycosyltransferase family 9 protein [Cytophagaceae bacterium]|nr:glycosyltransferase family 9 protein [Cytophagaceae bacterium]